MEYSNILYNEILEGKRDTESLNMQNSTYKDSFANYLINNMDKDIKSINSSIEEAKKESKIKKFFKKICNIL